MDLAISLFSVPDINSLTQILRSFRQPPFVLTRELEDRLLNFLARSQTSAVTTLLTSVSRPIRDPPRACDILPALEGSAGKATLICDYDHS